MNDQMNLPDESLENVSGGSQAYNDVLAGLDRLKLAHDRREERLTGVQ